MTNANDPIPAPCPEVAIFISEAFVLVYRALSPGFEILEERLNPASSYYDAFQEQDAKDRAYQEATRNFDSAQRRANEWLRDRLCEGVLTALIRDPVHDHCLKYKGHLWASMGDFETGIADDFFGPHGDTFQFGPNTVIRGQRRPVFFDRKEFENVLSGIAQPTIVIDKLAVINKGGRPLEYKWDVVEAFVRQTIIERGKPHRDNKRLRTKAELIELIQDEFEKLDQYPSISTIKYHLDPLLAKLNEN
jgi:hypothetical protein